MKTNQLMKGFTLIELMITVAAIAILSAIALPSYKEYVMKSRRADAKAGLLDLQIKQEKYRANCPQYASGINTTMSCAGGTYNLIGQTSSPDGNYTLSIVSATATAYTLKATRTGPQTGDKCGDFQIDHNGTKSLASGTYASGYDVSKCW
jgi:type IV pilus assembly protein PilE